MPINWEMYRKEMNSFRIMNNLDDMMMDELQERLNSGDVTFGEMREIVSVFCKANILDESRKRAEKAESEKEKHYKEMQNCLRTIRDLIDDVIDYEYEDDEEDW